MRYINDIKRYTVFTMLVIPLVFGACKKNKPQPDPEVNEEGGNTKQTATTNRMELTNDSLFLYAKQIYYWNEDLPTYDEFEPRQYKGTGNQIDHYNDNLFNLVKVSNSPDYVVGSPFPKYSYIEDITERNPEAVGNVPGSKLAVDLEGNGNDVGLRLGYYGTESDYAIYVSAVYPNSPADHAGFVRGDLIEEINGAKYGADFNSDIVKIESATAGSSVTFKGLRKAVAFTATLNSSSYSSSPVYKNTVLTVGSKKIGYLSYARFSSETNSVAALDAAFSDFAAKGVTDLIIDLRYNGGGYVSTAEHLINLIVPSGTSGTMFTEHYNSTMSSGKATIMENQPIVDDNGRINGNYLDYDYSVNANTTTFRKAGALTGVKNVVFIVTGSTASASELVINSLKPHMNVKLVGQTSYGKPVGFFPITLQNKYEVFFSMFETKNSKDEGGYFNGMNPDVEGSELLVNDVMYDFGSPKDNYTAKAINLLAPGVVVNSQSKIASVQERSASPSLKTLTGRGSNGEFIGMIENRKKLK